MSATRECFESFNRAFIAEFRATNGKLDSPAGQRLIAILTTGDPNGQVRPVTVLLTEKSCVP